MLQMRMMMEIMTVTIVDMTLAFGRTFLLLLRDVVNLNSMVVTCDEYFEALDSLAVEFY